MPGDSLRDEISKRYAETRRLLFGDALRSRVRCIDVSAEGTSEELVDRIVSELENIFPTKRLDTSVLFVREAETLD